MRNVLKIRLVYSGDYIPEMEYLKKFFEFIGCLVIDQCTDYGFKTLYPVEWDDILIFINYFSEKPASILEIEHQLYLYFNIKDGIAQLTKGNPLTSSYSLSKESNSKRETRRKALELLVSTIWEDDEANKKAITEILECYIPRNGDDDLFIALQEEEGYLPFLDWEISLEERKKVGFTWPYLTTPTLNMLFSEFKRMEELLRNLSTVNERKSPYLLYALVNVRNYMTVIHTMPKVERGNYYFGEKELLHYLDVLRTEYPWFVTEILLRANVYAFYGYRYSQIVREYASFLSRVDRSSPYYRFGLFEDVCAIDTWKHIKGDRFLAEQAINVLKVDQNYYIPYYYIAKMYIYEGRFEEADKAFISLASHINKTQKNLEECYVFPNKKLLYLYTVYYTLSKICIIRKAEHEMMITIKRAILTAKSFRYAILLDELYEKDERTYKEFDRLHYDGEVSYMLFLLLKPWLNITKDSFALFLLRKALKEFREDIKEQ